MEKTGDSDRPKKSGRTGPEPAVVEVRCNLTPDAQERLRRVFTILAKYAVEDGLPALEEDSPMEDSSEVEG